MGGALSAEEKKMLIPHLQDFNLDTLSAIIWDTINLVGVDDEREKFGIHFDEPKPEEENPKEENPEEEQEKETNKVQEKETNKEQMVTFWDGENVQTLPFLIFADIILYIGEEKIKELEVKDDLKEANDTTPGLSKLKLAVEYLKGKVEHAQRLETGAEYRRKIDDGEIGGASGEHKLVNSARERSGTQMWSAGKPEPKTKNKIKGIESMMDRHPELQKNHGKERTDKFKRRVRIVQLAGLLHPNKEKLTSIEETP